MLQRIVHPKLLNNAKSELTKKELICKENELRTCIRQRRIEAAMKVFQTLLDSSGPCHHSARDYFRSVRNIFKHQIKPLLEPTRMGAKILLEYSKFLYENEEELKCQRYFLRALKFYTYFLGYCEPSEAIGIFGNDFQANYLKNVVDLFQRTRELQVIQDEFLHFFVQTKSDCSEDLVLIGMIIANIYFRMKETRRSLKENRNLLRFISGNAVLQDEDRIHKILQEIGQCHEMLGDTGLAIKTYEKMFYDNENMQIKIQALYLLGNCFYKMQDYEKAYSILFDLIGEIVKNYRDYNGTLYLQFDHLKTTMVMVDDCHAKLGIKKVDNGSWRTPGNDYDYFHEIPKLMKKVENSSGIPLGIDIAMDLLEAWILYLKGPCFEFNNWKIYEAKSRVYLCEDINFGLRLPEASVELEKAIKHSDDEDFIKEKRCKLSEIYQNLNLLDEAIEIGASADCDEGLIRQISLHMDKRNPKRALEMISDIFIRQQMREGTRELFQKCMLLKIICHIMLQENEQAFRSMKLLETKKSKEIFDFQFNMVKGMTLMRRKSYLDANKSLTLADFEYKNYSEDKRSNCCTFSSNGLDDDIFTNLVFLVLNSHFLGYDYDKYLKTLHDEFLLRSSLMKWCLRFCCDEEIRIFETLYYSFSKPKLKKPAFMLYKNSLKLSLLFERARNSDFAIDNTK